MVHFRTKVLQNTNRKSDLEVTPNGHHDHIVTGSDQNGNEAVTSAVELMLLQERLSGGCIINMPSQTAIRGGHIVSLYSMLFLCTTMLLKQH